MSELPDPPVKTVESWSVTGAKIMHGTWDSGETGVLISAVFPYDVVDAQLAIEAGEL